MNLECLNGLPFGLDLLDHFRADHGVKAACPVVGALLGRVVYHSIQKDLNYNQEVLVREEHEVFQRCINLVFHLWVDVGVGVG